MTDRPILFSGPMVRALLDGRKTQTRRVLTAACEEAPAFVDCGVVQAYDENDKPYRWPRTAGSVDRLYVREHWRSEAAYDDLSPSSMGGEEPIRYEADGAHQTWGYPAISNLGRFRQSMHMPRWASRITLIVTDVRVQRLQEITNEDCIAEGIPVHPNQYAPRVGAVQDDFARQNGLISHYGAEFRELWDSLNAARGYGWETNPWIVAITFRAIKQNIDQIREQAA